MSGSRTAGKVAGTSPLGLFLQMLLRRHPHDAESPAMFPAASGSPHDNASLREDSREN